MNGQNFVIIYRDAVIVILSDGQQGARNEECRRSPYRAPLTNLPPLSIFRSTAASPGSVRLTV
jgi:hypothetical protein